MPRKTVETVAPRKESPLRGKVRGTGGESRLLL